MGTIHIPMSKGYATGAWEGVEDLAFRLPHTIELVPHAVHMIDQSGTARREYGGPELPGPYAFLTPRVVAPDPVPVAHRLTPDDMVELNGLLFRPRAADDFVVLDLVAVPATI